MAMVAIAQDLDDIPRAVAGALCRLTLEPLVRGKLVTVVGGRASAVRRAR